MVPFVDLSIQHRPLLAKFSKALLRTVSESSFILSPAVTLFEANFAAYLGAKYCTGVANGTEAISLALRALDLHPGDEVIIPANTFIATALAATHVGVIPVLTDVDPDTYNLNPDKVVKKITSKTKAIIPVHLYGLPANLPQLQKIAKKHGLYLVEDCAQAHGAAIGKQKVSTFGDIACFSFYPAKNLGALGDGGAVVTNSEPFHQSVNLWHNYGQTQKYYHALPGYNSRLDSLQASFLDIKLPYLDKWNKSRQLAADRYHTGLRTVPEIKLPFVPKGYTHVYHLYVIRTQRRDELIQYLSDQGIKTLIHYPVPIHLQLAYKNLGYKSGDFPIAERLAREIISLPMYPGLTASAQHQVISAIKSFYAK